MRICTITCVNADNHGARLQAYALSKYLIAQGNDVHVIDYRPPYMNPRFHILYWPGLSVKEWAKFFLRFLHRFRSSVRHKRFVSFSERFIPLTGKVYHNISELREDPPEADIYIAGSDQIWNTYFPNGTDPAFYLDFGPEEVRRESFAASFATKTLRSGTEAFVRENLRRFDRITVREKSGLDILERLGCQGELREDPVFLLSATQWDEISDGTGEGKLYVLVYDFFSDEKIKKTAKSLSQGKRLKIYAVCPFCQHYADKNFVTSGPETFVSLVRHASYVVTNSFHAIAFCMIFDRPFKFVERPDGMNDRIHDLLTRKTYRDKGDIKD